MKEVIRYKCGFCNKLAAKPETILKHEQECVHNPKSRNCYLCKYSTVGGWVDTPFGEVMDEHIPYCQLHLSPLPHLRADGFTALNCDDFIRDEDTYYGRSEKDAQENIEKFYRF